jgi:hypothetical protein
MATTTNYGWTTPDDTALVKDGASAIRSLGTSVDTTTKNLNPSTTLGDIEYRSSTANTNTRLGIGSTGQVLTVAGGVPSWASATASGKNYSLLNTGGTALTGANTITVSGISSKNSILVIVINARSSTQNVNIIGRVNTDSTAKYSYAGQQITVGSSYSTAILNGFAGIDDTSFRLGTTSGGVDSAVQASFLIEAANSTGIKSLDVVSGASAQGSNGHKGYTYKGIYTGTSAISSISIIAQAGDLDQGTVYVYTSAS